MSDCESWTIKKDQHIWNEVSTVWQILRVLWTERRINNCWIGKKSAQIDQTEEKPVFGLRIVDKTKQVWFMLLVYVCVGPDATAEDYGSIAVHFENDKNHYLAGKFFFLAGKHSQVIFQC